MDDVIALNRKPIPLRPIRRVEDRGRIKTSLGLQRAIEEEIVGHHRQIQEIERREARVFLKLQADQDHFDDYWEWRENQLHVYHNKIDQAFDELFALQRRTDPAAEKTRRHLRRTLGAYAGLISQHEQRAGEPEQIRCALNDWADERLEALEKLKAPRSKRNAELFQRLESVRAAIATHGETCLLPIDRQLGTG